MVDTCSTRNSLQQQETSPVAGVVGDRIYAGGGHVSPLFGILSSLEEYTPEPR
jgi:hypothetical protein